MGKANLCGADLREIKNILGVYFWEGAIYNSATLWPKDFNPVEKGAVLVADENLRQVAHDNSYEGFHLVFRKVLEGFFIDLMEQNEGIFAKFMNDPEFKAVVEDGLGRQVYDQIRPE